MCLARMDNHLVKKDSRKWPASLMRSDGAGLVKQGTKCPEKLQGKCWGGTVCQVCGGRSRGAAKRWA